MAVVRERVHETEDIEELRRYVAELEQRLADYEQARTPIHAALAENERFLRTLFAHTPVGLTLQRLDGALLDLNPAFTRVIGYSCEELVHQLNTLVLTPPEYRTSDEAQVQRAQQEGSYGPYEKEYVHKSGQRVPVRMHGMLVERNGETLIWSTIEDISEQVQAQASRRTVIYQEERIKAQQAALEELSTPLIPIGERVVVMPLVGAIDQARAERIITTLLEGVQRSRALTAIIDVTGVALIDTYVAAALMQAAQAAQMLGTRVLLTGISPEVAQTLVGLNVDLSGITTFPTLQRAVAVALR